MNALNSYSGISFIPFAKATCQDTFWGRTCPQLYGRLWRPGPVPAVPLADLFRLQTVVVQNRYLPGRTSVRTPPPGWRITERTASVTVVRRIRPAAWPDGRVSWAAPSVRISTDQAGQESEQIRYTGSGHVTLAMLAWPGWQATVDGSRVPLHMDSLGLVTLDLPTAPPTGAVLALQFVPPGYRIGVPLFYTGLALGLGYGAAWTTSPRRRRREPISASPKRAGRASTARGTAGGRRVGLVAQGAAGPGPGPAAAAAADAGLVQQRDEPRAGRRAGRG